MTVVPERNLQFFCVPIVLLTVKGIERFLHVSNGFVYHATSLLQLDLRSEMALVSARPATKLCCRSIVLGCLGCSCLSDRGPYAVGDKTNCSPGPRHNRFSSYYGWNGSFVGFLCNHVVVANAVAEFKYVNYPFSYVRNPITLSIYVIASMSL